jgi:hypothetical protein
MFPLVTADPASPEFLQVRFCKSVSQVYDRTQRVNWQLKIFDDDVMLKIKIMPTTMTVNLCLKQFLSIGT